MLTLNKTDGQRWEIRVVTRRLLINEWRRQTDRQRRKSVKAGDLDIVLDRHLAVCIDGPLCMPVSHSSTWISRTQHAETGLDTRNVAKTNCCPLHTVDQLFDLYSCLL